MKNHAKLLVPLVLLSGCATKDFVKEQIDPVNNRLDSLERRADAGESAQRSTDQRMDEAFITLKVHSDRLTKNETDIAQVSRASQEALERAATAGKLAEGRMAYEVVLSDEKVKFAINATELSREGRQALDDFIEEIKGHGRGVYIEVQGHTDNSGGTAANLKIGQERADAVLRYLHDKGDFPMHRLAAMSYGETRPLASNATREGRAKNRRVVLVVLY